MICGICLEEIYFFSYKSKCGCNLSYHNEERDEKPTMETCCPNPYVYPPDSYGNQFCHCGALVHHHHAHHHQIA